MVEGYVATPSGEKYSYQDIIKHCKSCYCISKKEFYILNRDKQHLSECLNWNLQNINFTKSINLIECEESTDIDEKRKSSYSKGPFFETGNMSRKCKQNSLLKDILIVENIEKPA